MDFDALERLGRLRASGDISDEEFEFEKQRLLGADPRPDPGAPVIGDVLEPPQERRYSGDLHGSRLRAILRGTVALFVLGIIVVVIVKTDLISGSKSRSASHGAAVKYALLSKVSGVHIARTSVLPENPHGADPSCSVYEKTPVGSAAKLVRSKGWHVIAENTVGQFDAVSFVGACAPLSGDAFNPIDPNVGMYEGNALRAVIYGKRLGFVESTDNPIQLRIIDKMNDQTIGRIAVSADRITVQK